MTSIVFICSFIEGNISPDANSVGHSIIQPKNKPIRNPNPVLVATLSTTVGEPLTFRLTPEGSVEPPGKKTTNSANASFQSSLNTREGHPTTMPNLTSRFPKLEKMFLDESATFTSSTTGIHFQYFSLYDEIRQLEAGNTVTIIWQILSVKSVFDAAKIARLSSDRLIEPATRLGTPIFKTHPHGTIPSPSSTLTVLDPLLASVHQCISVSSLVTTATCFNGPSRRPSTLIFVTNWIHWTPGQKQLGLIKAGPTRNPQFQQKQEFRQKSIKTWFLTLKWLVKLKVF